MVNMKKKIIILTIVVIIIIVIIIIILVINFGTFRNKKNEDVEMEEIVTQVQRNEKDEESKILNEYIDIPVTYQGSAKAMYVDRMDISYGDLDRREEDNMQVTYGGYTFFKGDEYKEIASDYWYGLYDEDFDINLDQNKLYVLVYGRKLVKLQYNPSKRSQFGRLANRMVVDWDNDLMKETVCIYECDYDPKEGGGALAIMTMEF